MAISNAVLNRLSEMVVHQVTLGPYQIYASGIDPSSLFGSTLFDLYHLESFICLASFLIMFESRFEVNINQEIKQAFSHQYKRIVARKCVCSFQGHSDNLVVDCTSCSLFFM